MILAGSCEKQIDMMVKAATNLHVVFQSADFIQNMEE